MFKTYILEFLIGFGTLSLTAAILFRITEKDSLEILVLSILAMMLVSLPVFTGIEELQKRRKKSKRTYKEGRYVNGR